MPAQLPTTRPATARSGPSALRASAFGLIAAALLAVLPTGPAWSQSDPVIAKVNGVEIHESDLAMAEEDVGQNQQFQALTGDARRDYLVSYLADVILAAKAAEGKKVADQKEFKSRLAFIRNKLLMETLLQQEGKAALTPDATKKVYDEAVKSMGNEQEVRARHILVPTEDEAKAVLAEIKKGTDFAELAKQKSKDPGAAAEGGDLGYFGKEQMVPEFAEVGLQAGQGPGVRSGEDAVRLAHHQGRGQAHQAGAGVRQGQGPGRDLCGAQGAGRLHPQAPGKRQDRAAG